MSKINRIVATLGIATALGIAAMPIATYAAATDTKNITVKVNVASVIALSADSLSTEVTMNPNNVNTTGLKTKLTVATNNKNGYKLTVKDVDSTTAMTSNDTIETIPALAGNLTAGTAGWNLSGGDLNKVAIAATDQTVKTNPNTAHVGIQEDIDMTYGVATSAAQAQGTYQDVIIYTATAL